MSVRIVFTSAAGLFFGVALMVVLTQLQGMPPDTINEPVLAESRAAIQASTIEARAAEIDSQTLRGAMSLAGEDAPMLLRIISPLITGVVASLVGFLVLRSRSSLRPSKSA
jgi:hypothetical protein